MTALPWTPLPWSPLAAWEPLSAACSWTTLTRGWVETTWQTCWPKSPTQRWWVQQWGKLRPARSNYSIILVLHNNALLIIIIATSHDSSIKGSLVNNSDDFSSGRLKLFTFHGESEGEQAFGSWLWSQTAAIKSSGRGNVFLKLRAHILVVGHMQFLHGSPPLAVCPSWWRNMFVMKSRRVFSRPKANEARESYSSCPKNLHTDTFLMTSLAYENASALMCCMNF